MGGETLMKGVSGFVLRGERLVHPNWLRVCMCRVFFSCICTNEGYSPPWEGSRVGGRSRGFDMFFSGSDQIPTLTYKKKENTLDMSRIRKNEL